MIKKGNDKVHLYNGDFKPAKLYKGDDIIADYEIQEGSAKNTSFSTEYKTPLLDTITGECLQESGTTPIYSVDGKALKYNQLIEYKTSSNTILGVTYTQNNGILKISGTASASGGRTSFGNFFKTEYQIKEGHKYLSLKNFSYDYFLQDASNYNIKVYLSSESRFFTSDSTYTALLGFNVNNGTTYNVTNGIVQLIDLTDMFGSENEPTTLDEFYSTPQGKLYYNYVPYGYHILGGGEYKSNQLVNNGNFPSAYGWNSPYGSLSVSNNIATYTLTTSHSSNRIEISSSVPKFYKGHKYYVEYSIKTNGNPTSTAFYLNNERFVSSLSSTTEWQTIKRIVTSTKFDGSGETSFGYLNNLVAGDKVYYKETKIVDLTDIYGLGQEPTTIADIRPDLLQYNPYHTTTTKNGIIFNDGRVVDLDKPIYAVNNVKDKWCSDGVIERKMGVVDLGSLEWNKYENGSNWLFYADVPNGKTNMLDKTTYCLNAKYKDYGIGRGGKTTSSGDDKTANWDGTNSQYLIKDTSYTDATSFKTAMSGVYLIYELATPTYTKNTALTLQSGLSVVNEEFTESTETYPSPQYPREVEYVKSLSVKSKNLYTDGVESLISVNSSDAKRYGIIYEGLNGYYTLSAKLKSGMIGLNQLCLKIKYQDNTYGEYNPLTSDSLTIQVEEGQKLLLYNGTSNQYKISYAFDDVILTKGNTPTSYQKGYPTQSATLSLYGINDVKDKMYVNQVSENIVYMQSGSFYASTSYNINNNIDSILSRQRSNIFYVDGQITISSSRNRTEIFYATSDTSTGMINYTQGWFTLPYTFNFNKKYVRFLIRDLDNISGDISNIDFNIMCVNGSSSKPYIPYLTNKVYINRKIGRVDLGSLSWSYNSTYKVMYNESITPKSAFMLCSKYKARWNSGDCIGIQNDTSDMWVATNKIGNTSGYIRNYSIVIRDKTFTDATSFKSAMSGVYLIYELNTPTWEDITDTELGQSLLGMKTNPLCENTLECDGVVEYHYYNEK